MSGGLFNPVGGSGLYGLLQTKRRIFVSYHHGGDRAYYDAFSRTFCDQYDVIEDNSLDRAIDSDDVRSATPFRELHHRKLLHDRLGGVQHVGPQIR